MSLLRHAFAHPWALGLLAVPLVLGLLAVLSQGRRRRALARLGRLPALAALASVHPRLRWGRALCRTAGLILLIVGIAGPQWGRDWQQATAPGRDVVVVLDMSRSMLAQDAPPSRLGWAEQALADLVQTVKQHGGHRLALVVFAARPKVVCPLTHDYDHFQDALAQLDPADPLIGPGQDAIRPPSGTRIGAALQLAVQISDPHSRNYQDILLISDGDDPARDGEWQMGVAAAREQHIPVDTIGVGDPVKEARIPIQDGWLTHEGKQVWTRLQEKPLEDIARLTGGIYTAAQTRALPLGQWFLDQIEPKTGREMNEDLLPGYRQRYAGFLAPALLLLAAEVALGQGRWRFRRDLNRKQVLSEARS